VRSVSNWTVWLLAFVVTLFLIVQYEPDGSTVLALATTFVLSAFVWLLWWSKPPARRYRGTQDRLKAVVVPATAWGRLVQLAIAYLVIIAAAVLGMRADFFG
jgi:hypothetical protein